MRQSRHLDIHNEGFTYSSVAPWKRNTILLLCFVETFLFAGTIFGWNILVFVLKSDGIYKDACQLPSNTSSVYNSELNEYRSFQLPYVLFWKTVQYADVGNDVHCKERSLHFSNSFTIATTIMGVFALPFGWLFDRTGLMVTRLLTTLLSVPGFLMIAFVTPETSVLIYPASTLIGVTSVVMFVTNYHVANLAGPRTSTVFSLYSGCVTGGGVIFLFIKIAHKYGVERKTTMIILTCLWGIVLITTIFLLPKYKIGNVQNILPREFQDSITGTYKKTSNIFILANPNKVTSGEDTDDIQNSERFPHQDSNKPSGSPHENMTFTDCLFSLPFLLNLFYFSVNHWRLLYFLGTFNLWATHITNTDEEKVDLLTDVFGASYLACLVMAPVVGLLIDRSRKHLMREGISDVHMARADVMPMFLSNVLQLLFSVLVLLAEKWMDIGYACSFIVHVVRGFFYASAFSFVGLVFPAEHFGKLTGFMYTVGGVVNFLQYPLLMWSNAVDTQVPSNILLLVVSTSTVIHPLLIFFKHRKYLNSRKKLDRLQSSTLSCPDD